MPARGVSLLKIDSGVGGAWRVSVSSLWTLCSNHVVALGKGSTSSMCGWVEVGGLLEQSLVGKYWWEVNGPYT